MDKGGRWVPRPHTGLLRWRPDGRNSSGTVELTLTLYPLTQGIVQTWQHKSQTKHVCMNEMLVLSALINTVMPGRSVIVVGWPLNLPRMVSYRKASSTYQVFPAVDLSH